MSKNTGNGKPKQQSSVGNKTILTKKLQSKIVSILKAGGTIQQACDSTGIGRSTFQARRTWCLRGRVRKEDVKGQRSQVRLRRSRGEAPPCLFEAWTRLMTLTG